MTFSIPNADLAYLLDGYLIDEENYRRVLDSVVRDPVNTGCISATGTIFLPGCPGKMLPISWAHTSAGTTG